MAAVLKAFTAVFLLVVALSGTWVSAQNHHVVGDDRGWGPDLNVTSWLLGRVFRVGDKIWFKYSDTEDSIVELQGLEEFLSCNLTNPIRMYTDRTNHVALEKEGVRYFTSGNPDNCKNGLKLPVPVEPNPELESSQSPPGFWPFTPNDSPPFVPVPPSHHVPVQPPPVFRPPPPHGFGPFTPDDPPPFVPVPPSHHVPVQPPPIFRPPPPPPSPPSAAAHLKALSFVLFAGLMICYVGI